MSTWWWVVFVLSVVLFPISCWFFYRNACRGRISWLNVVEIVAAVAAISYVASSLS